MGIYYLLIVIWSFICVVKFLCILISDQKRAKASKVDREPTGLRFTIIIINALFICYLRSSLLKRKCIGERSVDVFIRSYWFLIIYNETTSIVCSRSNQMWNKWLLKTRQWSRGTQFPQLANFVLEGTLELRDFAQGEPWESMRVTCVPVVSRPDIEAGATSWESKHTPTREEIIRMMYLIRGAVRVDWMTFECFPYDRPQFTFLYTRDPTMTLSNRS